MIEHILIFWTSRTKEEAKTIISGLLEKRLIACASLLPIESMYRWKDKIEESSEVKIILKTRKDHFNAIQNYIQMHCGYEVPEILEVNIVQGNPNYLAWVTQET